MFRMAILVILLICMFSTAAHAFPAETKFVLNQKFYISDGADIEMDASPFEDNDRIYVPIRYVAKAVGVPDNGIIWDGESGVVSLLSTDGIKVGFKIGEKLMYRNEAGILMDVEPILLNDRVFLPARYIAEAFNYVVNYDEQNSAIVLKMKKAISKQVENTEPGIIADQHKFYNLLELINRGGVKKGSAIAIDDVIVLSESPGYISLILKNNDNRLYLQGKNGKLYKTEFNYKITKKEGNWFVQDEDFIKGMMLGTLCSN